MNRRSLLSTVASLFVGWLLPKPKPKPADLLQLLGDTEYFTRAPDSDFAIVESDFSVVAWFPIRLSDEAIARLYHAPTSKPYTLKLDRAG